MATLITTISELQEYVKVNNGLNIQTVTPGLNEVELQTLVFYLGTPLLDIIKAEHVSQIFTARITAIYPYVRQALANLGVYKATHEIEVQIDDNGILRTETTSQKTAFGGQVARYRETIGNRGYEAIDMVLSIISANEATYPEWNSSAYYAIKNGLLFTSAKDFSQYENIKDSALTFQALAGYIKSSLDNLEGSLPTAIYTNIRSAAPTAENLVLINNYIKVYLSKQAIYQALIELPVVVDHLGVTVNQLQLNNDARTRNSAPNMFIERKMNGLKNDAQAALSRMSEFLNVSATDSVYAYWFGSEFYDEPWATKVANNSLTDEERKIYRA
jgi:hypothetical protein